MTLTEFKAWFEGYTEGLEGVPTKAQFDRIKERVKEIDGHVTTYPIYVERYVQPFRPYWGGTPWITTSGGTIGLGAATAGYASNASMASKGDSVTTAYEAHAAMYDLGRAEAQAA